MLGPLGRALVLAGLDHDVVNVAVMVYFLPQVIKDLVDLLNLVLMVTVYCRLDCLADIIKLLHCLL